MTSPSHSEAGMKWWVRYVVVPLIGSGGVIAFIAAITGPPTPPPEPVPAPPDTTITRPIEPAPFDPYNLPIVSQDAFEGTTIWPLAPIGGQYGQATRQLAYGEYCWYLEPHTESGGGWVAYAPNVLPVEDAFVEADVRFDTLNDGRISAGLVLRGSDQHGYELLLHPRGYLKVAALTPNGSRVLQDWLYTPQVNTAASNLLGFAIHGDTLFPYLNGVRYGRVIDSGLQFGNVALIARADGAMGGWVCFDNVVVRLQEATGP